MADLAGLKVHGLAQRANIAEAYGRFTFPEKIRFCHIARGSLVEFQSHLQSACHRHLITQEHFRDLKARSVVVGRMLNGFIKYLRSQTKRA